MRVTSLDPSPIHLLPYLRLETSSTAPTLTAFEVLRGNVERLPDGVAGLVVLSDLQGVVEADSSRLPLGMVLPEEFEVLAQVEGLPPTSECGCLLCGDLFVDIDLRSRGGVGDVRAIWRAFRRHFKWVAGVAGNHDGFGDCTDAPASAFSDEEGVYYLDGSQVDVDGLRVGGVSGILGTSRIGRAFRHDPLELVDKLRRALPAADVVLFHESPDGGTTAPGSGVLLDAIRTVCSSAPVPLPLLVSGHQHWPSALVELPGGAQVVNVDGRAVWLMAEGR